MSYNIYDNLRPGAEAKSQRLVIARAIARLPESAGTAISKQTGDAKIQQVAFISQLILARKQQGISQKELAELVGVSQPTIARLERGQHSPSLNLIFKIIASLDLQVRIEMPSDTIEITK